MSPDERAKILDLICDFLGDMPELNKPIISNQMPDKKKKDKKEKKNKKDKKDKKAKKKHKKEKKEKKHKIEKDETE